MAMTFDALMRHKQKITLKYWMVPVMWAFHGNSVSAGSSNIFMI